MYRKRELYQIQIRHQYNLPKLRKTLSRLIPKKINQTIYHREMHLILKISKVIKAQDLKIFYVEKLIKRQSRMIIIKVKYIMKRRMHLRLNSITHKSPTLNNV